jgi:hypothetical protein
MANYAIYGETKLPLTETDTIASVKDTLAKFYPEIRRSEGYIDENGDMRFRVSAGTKGANFAIYGETRLPLTETDTIASVKDTLAKFYPEIRRSEGYIDENGDMRFRVSAGTKGNN